MGKMKWLGDILISVTLLIVVSGCNTTPVQDGAAVGGVLGAAAGAIIGNQSGREGEGALVGAGIGAATGALIGDHVGRKREQRNQSLHSVSQNSGNASGHYETHIRTSSSGEQYEERVWVPDK